MDFPSASQPKFHQMWSNYFLHNSKAAVLSLVTLLSLDQDRLFYKFPQNHCTSLYLDLFFHYLFSLKQIESTLNVQNNRKIKFRKVFQSFHVVFHAVQ